MRRVSKNGVLCWNRDQISLSMVLAQEAVGFEPVAEGRWQLWFGPIYLGLLSELRVGKNSLLKNNGTGRREKTRSAASE